MAVIKTKNGNLTKVNPMKEISEELKKCLELHSEVDEVFISRKVKTRTAKERALLKNLCTTEKVDVMPLDRAFIFHKIFIRERTLEDAFEKLRRIKKVFG